MDVAPKPTTVAENRSNPIEFHRIPQNSNEFYRISSISLEFVKIH